MGLRFGEQMRREIRFGEKPIVECTFFVAAVVLAFFALYSHYVQRSSWFWDNIFCIFLLLVLFIIRRSFDISYTSAILVSLGLIFHSAGTFGLYSVSPLPFEYDVFTHFFGFFACAFLMHDALKGFNMSRSRAAFFIVVACLGIGSCVEMIEYTGYEMFGRGEGMFMMGDGDFGGDLGNVFGSDTLGGTWIDAMQDMMTNLVGAVVGVAVILLFRFDRPDDL